MSRRGAFARWTLRLLACLATAIAISATAYLCAWLNARNYYARSEAHVTTRRDLERLREEIERHKKTTGALPAQLTDLKMVADKEVPVDATGYPVDGWNQPFFYRHYDGKYELFSLGPERLVGGVGKYADMHAGKPDTWPEHPSLTEFSRLPEARPAQIACLLAGVVAFPLCLLQARGQPGEPPSLRRVLLGSAVTAGFAILAALMIGALHLMPGGH